MNLNKLKISGFHCKPNEMIYWKVSILSLLFMLPTVFGYGQSPTFENLTVSVDTSSLTSVRLLIDHLQSTPELNFAFDESEIDLDKSVNLPNDEDLTVKDLIEIITVATGTSYVLAGKQIVLKKNVETLESYSISGYIRDIETGEGLIGAIIRVRGTEIGVVTNVYGFYSITLDAGSYDIIASYVGYQAFTSTLLLDANKKLDVNMSTSVQRLDEIVVSSTKENQNVVSNTMGFSTLNAAQIEDIPALFGEVDVIKALKLLPGVSMTSEISSGFSVRGGSMDQNLILLDEATVYNASHLLGLFSTFNNDAINKVDFYKGALPAKYGGRLSSVVDVRMKEGNNQKITGKGGISLISSRLTLEVPIVKDRGSIMISGRRTYLDILARQFSEDMKESTLYFYDLNAKANYRLNDNNTIFVSAYKGRDIFKISSSNEFSPSFDWGNLTSTLRWNHLYSDKLFSNVSLIYSDYNYQLGFAREDFEFSWTSNLIDYTAKLDFDYYLNPNNTISFGASSIYHTFQPGKVTLRTADFSGELVVEKDQALEHALYISNEQKLGDLTLGYGFRYGIFQNVGEKNVTSYNEVYEPIDSKKYEKGDIYKTQSAPEYRLGATYQLGTHHSIKAGYSRTVQYMQLASNSIAGTPLDIWFPSSPNIKPQKSDQYSLGYFRNFFENSIEGSVEVYYKNLQNLIGFKDHAQLFLNKHLDGEIRVGSGQAYGMEFQLKKTSGKLTGWLSYTLARSTQHFDEVNNGKTFLSSLDRTHNVSVVTAYKLAKRLSISGTWTYFSGLPFTLPSGRYQYSDQIVPSYTDRNGGRFPNYHRMDVALNWKTKTKPGQRFTTEWNLSVYNLYSRKNTAMMSFETREDSNESVAIKYYLFPILPTISWNFQF